MKILSIFNHYLEKGGEAHAVEAIYTSLAKIAEMNRCEFDSADWSGADAPPTWQQAIWMFRNPRSVRQLRQCQASSNADVWLAHNVFPVGSAAVYSEAGKLGIPIIQYIHNFRPFSVNGYLWADHRLAEGGLSLNYWREIKHGAWQDSRAKTAWFANVLWLAHVLGYWRNVAAWIAISDFVRDKFISAGVAEEKIFTLRHFCRPGKYSSPGDGNHYLFLGRLTEEKGVVVLLEAWRILERRRGPAAPRLIIAGDGPLRSRVQSEAEKISAVTFAGRLSSEAKTEALANARAVIVPSIWWEALGLVVYEAYDHSRPVLAARSGGLGETVFHNQTGLLHEPGNAEQLASHVMELEEEALRRRTMGAKGRRWLEENTSEEKWKNQFQAVAEYALSRRE